MAKQPSTPTRITADVAAVAAAVAPGEHRSIAEQINYWTRIGMQIERSGTASYRRVIAVARGESQFSTLTAEERLAAHAVIDAGIAERVAAERFGPAARSAGQVTVSVDADGHLIEIAPGGGRRRL